MTDKSGIRLYAHCRSCLDEHVPAGLGLDARVLARHP